MRMPRSAASSLASLPRSWEREQVTASTKHRYTRFMLIVFLTVVFGGLLYAFSGSAITNKDRPCQRLERRVYVRIADVRTATGSSYQFVT
jgi:hypothetical protein